MGPNANREGNARGGNVGEGGVWPGGRGETQGSDRPGREAGYTCEGGMVTRAAALFFREDCSFYTGSELQPGHMRWPARRSSLRNGSNDSVSGQHGTGLGDRLGHVPTERGTAPRCRGRGTSDRGDNPRKTSQWGQRDANPPEDNGPGLAVLVSDRFRSLGCLAWDCSGNSTRRSTSSAEVCFARGIPPEPCDPGKHLSVESGRHVEVFVALVATIGPRHATRRLGNEVVPHQGHEI